MSAYASSSKAPQRHGQQYRSRRDYSPPPAPPRNHKPQSAPSGHPYDGNGRLTGRPSFPETFLDDLTPGDQGRAYGYYSDDEEGYDDDDDDEDAADQDSHDLAFSPNHAARTSVVDNMLMSLGHFPDTNGGSDVPDTDPYVLYSRYSASKAGRHRGHTFSSSLSSDPDTQRGADRADRYPEQHMTSYHGRKSNSSSNFPPNIPRTDPGYRTPGRSAVNDAQRAVYNSNKATDRTGDRAGARLRAARDEGTGTERRGSDTAGLDIDRFLASRRVGGYSGNRRRSASLDEGTRANAAGLPVGKKPGVSESRNASQDLGPLYDDIDAAPTPTVPAGPRKDRTPPTSNDSPSNSQAMAHKGSTPAPSRKSSAKSAKSMQNRKGRSDTTGTNTLRKHGGSYDRFQPGGDEEIPPVPTYVQPSAPSPTISRHKSSYFSTTTGGSNSNNPVESSPPPPAKERPGFFRRVFGGGSSKNASSTPTQSQRDHPGSRDNEPWHQSKGSSHNNNNINNNSNSNNNSPSNSKILKPSPMEKPSEANKSSRENTPVVTKKPSSFFRRRKKSTVDPTPPPLNLQQSNYQPSDPSKGERSRTEQLKFDGGAAPEPSPVSSLRKVMKPYLADGGSRTPQDPRQYPDNVEPSMDDPNDAADTSASNRKTRTFTTGPRRSYDGGEPQTAKPKKTIDIGAANHDRNDSFLADNSSNEGRGTRDSGEKYRRPMTSPTAPSYHAALKTLDYQQAPSLPGRTGNTLQVPPVPSTVPHASVNDHDGPPPALSSMPPSQGTSSEDADSAPPQQEKDWLDPGSSSEQLAKSSEPILPIEGTKESPQLSESTASRYHTASNTPITPAEDGGAGWGKPVQKPAPVSTQTAGRSVDSTPGPSASATTATTTTDNAPDETNEETPKKKGTTTRSVEEEEARKLFDAGGEEATDNEPTAAWLGGPERAGIRKAYMDLFDWSDMNILVALQSLCARIALKGEAQQVDRVLDAFSTRWCECNSNHGFKATDVVHTICYSLLLLNTDLHFADIEQKMTRTQFIRNTMPTIQRVVADAAPDAFESGQEPPGRSQTAKSSDGPGPAIKKYSTYPHSRRPSVVDGDADGTQTNASSTSHLSTAPDAGPLVTAPFRGTMKAWEVQVECVLKEFYNSIQKQRLPLRGVNLDTDEPSSQSNTNSHNNSLLNITGGMLRRTPSTLSKSMSENNPRGRAADQRPNTGRWSSKPRARPRLYPASTMTSSRTSFDDQSSIFSPSSSTTTWSKNSLGKTLTSMSVDSFSSEYTRGDYQQSIGFANALSHAIIREDSASAVSPSEDPDREPAAALEDESLELAGAPWAKEGSLKHKHHLDAVDKRSKDRNWNENFAVIQRGYMRLFNFNKSSTKSMRLKGQKQKPKGAGTVGGGGGSGGAVVVGGGNWTENAEETWRFVLRQAIASALPSPGYSKSRPHVWALSLPTGAVHLFQVGTPEIVKEFVSTVNYWSARLSKEPLVGAVSNIEYGWSDSVINSALANIDEPKPTSSASGHRPSIQSSIRGSLDQGNVRPRLPADRIHISDWSPPQQSMVAASLSEAEQLTSLRTYVKNIEEELQRHNELRGPMTLAFTPKHPNGNKALNNWERKSSYLLREIVKFRTYIDCLQTAQTQKEKILGSRTAQPSEAVNDDTQNGDDSKEKDGVNISKVDDHGAVG